MSTAIDIQDLGKTFPPTAGVKAAAAVDGVTLTIEPGELFFLLGPSGCGKTTLLRMIAGFIEPTSGRILFREDGVERDVTHLAAEKRNTGMVFQSYALWPHMTVEQNVAFGLEVRRVESAERARRVAEALAAVRMEALAARRPTQLSGGQQQRVALARAMVIRPNVLLLDEPLSNLDAKLRLELRGEIRRICKQTGITTVYVTHDQKEALSMADRVAVMSAGRVVQIGPPRELYSAPRSRFVAEFLGETNILAGRVAAAGPGGTIVETPAGKVTARPPTAGAPGVNANVLVSVRPEAVVLIRGGAGLQGTVRDVTYLGDTAQFMVELADKSALLAAVINPTETIASLKAGDRVNAVVKPADVVLLEA
ncbi:sulfate transport system ATP-binding protein [Phycisphaerales bacterium]|nr:sulfate transport system ATP-binding protein [Phycisphaerales bacterium]